MTKTTTRVLLSVAAALGLAAAALGVTSRGAFAQGEGSEEETPPPAGAAPGKNEVQRDTVRIVFKVFPSSKATVTWGKKKLGIIKPRESLVVQRPRDSGPMDVVVRAEGCLPVHTRAYTFTDSVVSVKVTPLDKKNTIYGYKEVPPDEDGGVGGPDGGVP